MPSVPMLVEITLLLVRKLCSQFVFPSDAICVPSLLSHNLGQLFPSRFGPKSHVVEGSHSPN